MQKAMGRCDSCGRSNAKLQRQTGQTPSAQYLNTHMLATKHPILNLSQMWGGKSLGELSWGPLPSVQRQISGYTHTNVVQCSILITFRVSIMFEYLSHTIQRCSIQQPTMLVHFSYKLRTPAYNCCTDFVHAFVHSPTMFIHPSYKFRTGSAF